MNEVSTAISAELSAIRSKTPVILNLTNFVAMDLTANALLAVGASPMMAQAGEELAELVDIASAVVINIGTLDAKCLERMAQAIECATLRGKPIVLDPVGAGASKFRTQSARMLLESGAVSVIRGNASEIVAVFGNTSGTRGVDAVISSESAVDSSKEAVRSRNTVIVISGVTDQIIQREGMARVYNGTALMTKVTAMGCTASSLIAAFLSVNPSAFHAATNAMAVMGVCGEVALKESKGPGTFRSAFLDVLAKIGQDAAADFRVSFA